MNAADLVRYARTRIIDGAPPKMVEAELGDLGCAKARAPGYVERAQAAIERDLDGDDTQRIREYILAAASERVRVARLRREKLLAEIKELEELELPGGDATDAVTMLKARASRIRLILSIDRTVISYENLAHRAHRDPAVALVPKETRQDTREPTDQEIDAAIIRALDIPAHQPDDDADA